MIKLANKYFFAFKRAEVEKLCGALGIFLGQCYEFFCLFIMLFTQSFQNFYPIINSRDEKHKKANLCTTSKISGLLLFASQMLENKLFL